MRRTRLAIIPLLLLALAPAAFGQAGGGDPQVAGCKLGTDDSPTYIKANSLSLKTNERTFVYTGNVEVTHGEMKMTADVLEGHYDAANEIETLIARSNVVITRGTSMRGTCQKAIYEKKSETVTLTENPELQQDQSVLTADSIVMYLEQDRSTAEGNVRVKLVKPADDKDKGGKKGDPSLPMP